MLGDKYPGGIGQPAADCWPDVWPAMGPLAEGVLAGRIVRDLLPDDRSEGGPRARRDGEDRL
ncbi:hypothetical protein D7223_25785 [Micromonospora endolithica]|uniref:Uncharacterized protein n=1 Tax=Micromonospora endolithica TaxID=230091 RepID=A0A3A9YXM0_9ACTN|nr:hypothetical protein D7223_25785 [Micromonospora endolithica]TWJ21633.1 hypothetical protein JD76_01743 [Micromonospora endolithica]